MTNWHDWLNMASPLCLLLSALLAPELGRRAGKKQVEAALLTASADMKTAVAEEREAVTADWGQFTQGMQRWNESLAGRLGEVEQRLSDSEIRAVAAEMKATSAEKNYRIAIAYLRSVIRWVDEHWPSSDRPEPPPELLGDL
jgi:hypothetical protein